MKMTRTWKHAENGNGSWHGLALEANEIAYSIDAPYDFPAEEREGNYVLTVTRADGSEEIYWTDTQKHAKAIVAADVEMFA